jgi:hypothetical protein
MRHSRRLGHCLAAGALAGAALLPLQLVLWPGVRLDAGQLGLAVLAWTSWAAVWLGGTAFLFVEAASLPLPDIAIRRGLDPLLWRWLVTSVGLLVAGITWWNHTRLHDFLTPGQRDALAAAGIGAGLVVVVQLAVLLARRHAMTHPPWALLFPALLLVAAWGSFVAAPPAPLPVPPAVTPRFQAGQRVLVVSWEGADLPWLLPAIERGDMPFLRDRRDAGAWGQLRSLRPYSRAASLATLATGCSPATHGVVARRGYRLPFLGGAEVALLLRGPWTSPYQLPWRAWERIQAPPSQRAPLWEILSDAGQQVGVVGWPGQARAAWQIPPPLAAETMPYETLDAELRAALDPAIARNPGLADPTRFAFAIAAEIGAGAALSHARHPVDALVVATDLPARLRPLWTGDEPTSSQAEVLRQVVRLLDEQLHALWALMGGEETTLVVVSPFGMAPPSSWRRLQGVFGAGSRWRVSPEDSPNGFVLLSGPGVRPGTRLRGARLADVTATVLYLANLPIARDMSGRVLLDAVTEERAAVTPLRLVPSYPAGEPRR